MSTPTTSGINQLRSINSGRPKSQSASPSANSSEVNTAKNAAKEARERIAAGKQYVDPNGSILGFGPSTEAGSDPMLARYGLQVAQLEINPDQATPEEIEATRKTLSSKTAWNTSFGTQKVEPDVKETGKKILADSKNTDAISPEEADKIRQRLAMNPADSEALRDFNRDYAKGKYSAPIPENVKTKLDSMFNSNSTSYGDINAYEDAIRQLGYNAMASDAYVNQFMPNYSQANPVAEKPSARPPSRTPGNRRGNA